MLKKIQEWFRRLRGRADGRLIMEIGPAREEEPRKSPVWIWVSTGGALCLLLVAAGYGWYRARQAPPPAVMTQVKPGETSGPQTTGAVIMAKAVSTNLPTAVTGLVASVVKSVGVAKPEPPRASATRVKVTAPEYATAFLAGAGKRLRFDTNAWQTIQSLPYLSRSVLSGLRRVGLEVDGFSCSTLLRTTEAAVLVESDRTNEVEFVLTPRPATLTVSCNVTQALVQVSGLKSQVSAPLSVPSLRALTLTVSATGYVAQVIEVGPLNPGQEQKKDIKLEPVSVSPAMPLPTSGAGKPMTVDLGGGVKLELVWVPPGSFEMGDDDEKPPHQVRISKGFWMGKYEVTQAQWQQVMGGNPSHFQGENLPADSVSWNDCQEFLKKMNSEVGIQKPEGGQFRLPTEA